MARKTGILEKIGLMVYEKPNLNKKVLHMKKSFDEINTFLQKGKIKQ